ncbi:MAG: hypothetical protein IT317_21940 [Anaerolineales bacterium]|nr:hypothetical protein [Anaerolineales bacterium]
MPPLTTFNLEHYAANSRHYFEQLVDADGLPYFDVFWTTPPEAAHDWPDFSDVMSRQWQGAVFMRRMTGQTAATEQVWARKTLEMLNPADGQFHRPATAFCTATIEDACLPLYALATAALDNGDPAFKHAAARMTEGYLRRLVEEHLPDSMFGGFGIKSFMVTARLLGSEPALDVARRLVDRSFRHSPNFPPGNDFGPRVSMHGNLRTLLGTADFALATGDPELYSRVEAFYRFVKTTGTRFGWLPEAVNYRTDPLVGCETCALMDFAGLGVTLANHGHPEYWGDMERLARNHYVESQITDVAWLGAPDNNRADTDRFTWRDVGRRIVGAWAGWSSPNHILAYHETLNFHWADEELRDKVRVLQNCCGGSGVHGLFTLWKNAARFEAGTLSVHMHLDKLLPQAEIRCEQPYRGRLRISLKTDAAVRVRIPEFTRAAELRVTVNDQAVTPALSGIYLELGPRRAGDQIVLNYPLPVTTEDIAVGNPGYRQWPYRITWKGDTVLRVEALDTETTHAYSEFDGAERRVYYGPDGPGPLYQREHYFADTAPADAPLHLDDGALDLWKITR